MYEGGCAALSASSRMSGLHPSVARAIQRWQQREHDAKVGEAASQPVVSGNKNKRSRDETTDEVKAVAVSETLAADRPAQRQKAGPSKADEVKAAAVLRQVNLLLLRPELSQEQVPPGASGQERRGIHQPGVGNWFCAHARAGRVRRVCRGDHAGASRVGGGCELGRPADTSEEPASGGAWGGRGPHHGARDESGERSSGKVG